MNASAVDMEGAAVAQICRQFTVPYLVIRGISDSADASARQQAGMYLGVAVRNSPSSLPRSPRGWQQAHPP